MITESLQSAFESAQHLSLQRKSSHVRLEFLLLALTEEKDARHAILACGGDPDYIAGKLHAHLKEATANGEVKDDRLATEIEPDLTTRAILEQATSHVMTHRGRDSVTGADVLMAIVHRPAEVETNLARELLHTSGVTPFALKRFLSHGDAVDDEYKIDRQIRGSASGQTALPLSASLMEAISSVLHNEPRPGPGHGYFTLDHVLLVLLKDEEACNALRTCGADLSAIEQLARKSIRIATAHENGAGMTDEAQLGDTASDNVQPFVATVAVTKVLKRATELAMDSKGNDQVSGLHILTALCEERESHAAKILGHAGLTAKTLHRNSSSRASPVKDQDEASSEKPKALGAYCRNLNELAREGKFDPLIGREDEVRRCFQALLRRNKNNPMLVGDPGVGKTAIVEGIAGLVVEGQVPEQMSALELYALDMGEIVAGTKYRGEFEERLTMIVKEIQQLPDAVLCVDEVHTVVGAGSTSGSSMDASNILKPSLQDGSLRCIGSTTHRDYKRYLEKDRALARRFQKIEVREPSMEETVKILMGLRDRLGHHHNVRFTNSALMRAVELADRYVSDRNFPDKAIDIIDEAGATNQLQPQWRRKKSIRIGEIEDVVATMARIPPRQLSSTDAVVLVDLEESLKQVVFGQDTAIEAVSGAVKLSRAGLREPGKPMGSYLFSGPTGVGKTEVARQLAAELNCKLLRFDMSEFMEKHSVSRLIGAPPGYIGFDQGGLLTDGVDENPYCIVLLDEIEKAHPDVVNILLQVMDYGKLTDHSGRTVDFRNAIIIMTTNAGAVEQARSALGFGKQRRSGEDAKAIERTFSPEFRNRLDAMIGFDPLSRETIIKVVGKFVGEMEAQLAERNVKIDLTDEAANWLANRGYDDVMGARPMARLIQETIKRPLADMILFGDLRKGGIARVFVSDDQLAVEIVDSTPKRLENKRVPLIPKP
ncbi:MAG: AAA family ATPase [Rhodobacteraceae bacterium]|nr:AAA family ATPase [Paracoccaceae bacterium]